MSRSCRRATELMSLQMEQPLTLGQQIVLRGHLLTCSGCRRAKVQMGLLRQIARQVGGHEESRNVSKNFEGGGG
jgi:predicted anti-sigma-YlaC factor YlaD